MLLETLGLLEVQRLLDWDLQEIQDPLKWNVLEMQDLARWLLSEENQVLFDCNRNQEMILDEERGYRSLAGQK